MKNKLNGMLYHMIVGISVGSFVYLIVLMVRLQLNMPSLKNGLSIIVMSALIGLLSMIFSSDKLAFIFELVIHLVGTLLLVMGTALINGWSFGGSFWLSFIAIYLAVWLMIIIYQKVEIKRMNQKLISRQSSKNL